MNVKTEPETTFSYQRKNRDTPAGTIKIITGFTCEVSDPTEFGFQRIWGEAEIVQAKVQTDGGKTEPINSFQYSWTIRGSNPYRSQIHLGKEGAVGASLDTHGEKYHRKGEAGTAREASQLMQAAVRELIENRPDRLYEELVLRYDETQRELTEFLEGEPEVDHGEEAPREQPETPLNYHIQVDPQHVRDLEQELHRIDAPFHRRDNLLALEDEKTELSHLRGAMVPELVERINEHLQKLGMTPELLAYHEDWSPGRCGELLQFALEKFNWQYMYELEDDNFRGNPEAWRQNARNHPGLFWE